MLEDIVKGRVIPQRPGRAFAVASVTFVCRKAALTQPQIAILSAADFAEDATLLNPAQHAAGGTPVPLLLR